jgi:hypothetical protein
VWSGPRAQHRRWHLGRPLQVSATSHHSNVHYTASDLYTHAHVHGHRAPIFKKSTWYWRAYTQWFYLCGIIAFWDGLTLQVQIRAFPPLALHCTLTRVWMATCRRARTRPTPGASGDAPSPVSSIRERNMECAKCKHQFSVHADPEQYNNFP